jgi:hypothetical protein
MFQQTVAGFAQALEESDLYTRGHSERVATYAEIIARGLTLPDAEVQVIVQSGVMHDVGKIGVRYDMLNKPGKLTPEEVQVFRQHPEKGKRILAIRSPACTALIDGCWCHHEWFDGGGYPRGLSGQNIPLVGRIVAIARRLRRHDVRPRLPPRPAPQRRGRRDRALRRDPVRPRGGRGVRQADRGLPRRDAGPRRGLAAAPVTAHADTPRPAEHEPRLRWWRPRSICYLRPCRAGGWS